MTVISGGKKTKTVQEDSAQTFWRKRTRVLQSPTFWDITVFLHIPAVLEKCFTYDCVKSSGLCPAVLASICKTILLI